MGDVITPTGMITTADMPADKVLKGAIKHDLDHVLVLGTTKDGEMYFAGTTSDLGKILVLLKMFDRDVILA